MIRLRPFTKLFFLVTLSTPATAEWSSGGGELSRDSQNPWFLQNTRDVQYCIKIDEDNFHVNLGSQHTIDELIRKSISYWKEEFDAAIEKGTHSKLRIATQNFIRVPCPEEETKQSQVDITFQFGTLTGEQIEKIGDPTEYVGLSVRTQYDPVALRGKGFIYLAADSGPLRFKGRNLQQRPWALGNGGILHKALLHELGHVFGVSHTGATHLHTYIDPTQIDFMSADFLERLVSAKNQEAEVYGKINRYGPFFNFHSLGFLPTTGWCVVEPPPELPFHYPFFGLREELPCIRIEIKNEKEFQIIQWAPHHPPQMVGRGKLGRPHIYDRREIIRIHLTESQRVFPDLIGAIATLSGPKMLYEERKGTYETTDGRINRKIWLKTRQIGFDGMSGIYNDTPILNLYGGD